VAVRVALDAAAVRAAEVGGGSLATRVRLDDLTAAGWTVSDWKRSTDGAASLTVAKAFTRPEQVGPIVRELNGPNGPFRRFAASRDASTFSTAWEVTGTVDRRRVDLGIADDAELVASLTNERVDVAGVEARVADAVRGLALRARVELPDGTTRVVTASPGRRAVLVATADDTDLGRVALVAVGVIGAVLAAALLVSGEVRSRRRRSRRSLRSRP
jgi:hypothetical protein